MTNRKLKTRAKEHRKDVDKLMKGRSFTRGARKESETDRWKSCIMDHAIKENHVIGWQSVMLVGKEVGCGKRAFGEVITIGKHPHSMNRDQGRYFLSPLYDDFVPRYSTQD